MKSVTYAKYLAVGFALIASTASQAQGHDRATLSALGVYRCDIVNQDTETKKIAPSYITYVTAPSAAVALAQVVGGAKSDGRIVYLRPGTTQGVQTVAAECVFSSAIETN